MRFIKRFFKTIGILAIIVIILALLNRWYLGGFKKLDIKEQAVGPYTIAYMEHTGNYATVGAPMQKVYEALSGADIMTYTGIGIYYDDPAAVAESELRSDIGAVIDAADSAKISDPAIKINNLPVSQSIVIAFPLKNASSYMAGTIKVYPALRRYMQEKGYDMQVPVMEFYDMQSMQIYYVAKIAK